MGIGPGIDRWGAILLDAGLSAAVLTGLAGLAIVAHRQPARRQDLARLAWLGSLAMLPLTAFGPVGPRLEVVPPLRAVLAPLRADWQGPDDAPGTIEDRDPIPAARGSTVLYLAGASACLGWIALGSWAARRLVRAADRPDEATLLLYESLPWTGRRPRLRVSARVRGPALLGLVRSTIVIPPALERPEARDRLRLALLHELAHAERGDPGSGLIAGLAQAAWFVFPWVWWIGRQARLDREFLADLRASEVFGAPGPYASSLVDQAAPGRSSRPSSTASASLEAAGPGSALFQRVLMLVRCPFRLEVRSPGWWLWSLRAIAAVATLLASLLTFEDAEAAPRPDPVPRMLRIPRLVLAEVPARADGWSPHHDLLIPLPERFELAVDVWALPDDIGRIRIAGQGLPPASEVAPGTAGTARWHRVQVRRDRGEVQVRVDGRPVPPDRDPDPDVDPAPAWLCLQPAPGRVGVFRELVLSW